MINVGDVNESPTDIALSNATISENLPHGTLVGFLTTTDPDATGTFTYTLVSGTGDSDNGSFTIAGNRLRTAGPLDYETRSGLSIRVRATDQGGLSTEKTFTVSRHQRQRAADQHHDCGHADPGEPVAGPPRDPSAATDPDAGSTFTFALVEGEGSEDNAKVTLFGTMLRTTARFDYETQSCLHIRVRATDQGGLSVEKALTLDITDVNEQPTAVLLDGDTVEEGLPPDALVGSLSTADPDFGGTFAYTLVDGDGSEGNASFTISGSELRTAAEPRSRRPIKLQHPRPLDGSGRAVRREHVRHQRRRRNLAPTVTGVVLGGTGWADSLAGGSAIPTGSGEQLLPLPWTGIDRLSVTFSEDVLVEQNDLALYGVNVAQYDVGAGTFAYDSATFTATWTLAAAARRRPPDRLAQRRRPRPDPRRGGQPARWRVDQPGRADRADGGHAPLGRRRGRAATSPSASTSCRATPTEAARSTRPIGRPSSPVGGHASRARQPAGHRPRRCGRLQRHVRGLSASRPGRSRPTRSIR